MDKSAFHKVSGTVEFISLKYGDLPNRDFTKYRYIKINTYEKPFELYVGKDMGDFTPALDKLESIKRGDLLTFYFAKNKYEPSDESVNRLVYYIDKGTVPVFIFSPAQLYLAWLLISISLILTIIVVTGKIKGKIV